MSIGTVDRVLHDRYGVSPKTREKIKAIIKEIDYHPNVLARRLASKKVIHFATLIPSVSKETSFWSIPLQGIEQAEVDVKRYNIVIDKYFFNQNDKQSFIKETEKILKKKPDGILLAPEFIEEAKEFTNRCMQLGIPFVFIDTDIEGQGSLSYIGPHLYDSGYLVGNLVSYILRDEDAILLLNISKELEKNHHLLRKEEGFRNYFMDNSINRKIVKIDIKKTDPESIWKEISSTLSKHKDIKLIFITNSKASIVANHLRKNKKKYILIGYDFVQENIDALKSGYIDFLICQKAGQQAYRGIVALYQSLVHNSPVEKVQLMPIDIITKENYKFYKN